MSAMVQMNTANENFYQKEIAEVQDEIDLEIEEQQIAEEVLEATPFTELETLNKGDNRMYVEKVQIVHSANVGEKQNELEKSFVEDAVDELENEDEILSSKSEKRTRETNDTSLQDQKRLKIDEDEIDIDMEEESNKFSTNPQENQQQQVADEEIEITEDANSQVSSNPIQSSVVVVEPKISSRFVFVQKNDWSSLISELAHTLVTLGNLSLSDIYNLMLTCKSLNQFFNSHSDPWRSLALHSFTFKRSDSLMITKFAHFLDSWKEYCKIRKTFSLNIRNCILDALKNEDDDDSILDRMNSKLTILNNIRNMSNSFSARIMDSLNFDDNDDADLLFLVNNTYFSVSLEEGEEENTRVEREVIYVVGPYGDRIKVVKGKESQLQETIKELKGLRFTKDQYLEYINFYCCLTSIKKKSIYDIFTPLNTTVTTIDSTSEQQEVDIESEEEEDVDIL